MPGGILNKQAYHMGDCPSLSSQFMAEQGLFYLT